MSFRFRICLIVWITTVALNLLCSSAPAETYEVTSGWAMEISPALRVPTETVTYEAPQLQVPPASSESSGVTVLDAQPLELSPEPAVCVDPGSSYRRIYDSIPFNRAEYNVNPSYRHDSTMEILTGNPRHRTILNHSTIPQRPQRRTWSVLPYRYNNPYRGLNYYFYFPYWNYRGFY